MSDLHNKRKYAGEPMKDRRKGEPPDPMRLPPHKKPKTWGLTLEWTETITRQMSRQFTSRAARDEARTRIERYFRERAEAQKTKRPRRFWPSWYNSPLSNFEEAEGIEIQGGPTYTETYEEK
jgi:hypothetical protein